MNNENSNIEPVQNSPEIPEVGASTPTTEMSEFQTIDPTADFQTIDPTATEVLSPSVPVSNEPETLTETPAEVPQSRESEATQLFATNEVKDTLPPFDPAKIQPPKATPVNMSSVNVGTTRYNPVTGEEIDTKTIIGGGQVDPGVEVNNDEKSKKVEVEYKDPKKGNTIMLIIFFIFLILFVVFLPELQTLIALRMQGETQTEVITTGTLVCTYETNTLNLDRNIKREFVFTDNKLQSAKFVTIIRGDASLDEEALDGYNEQCVQIHNNVDGMNGVSVTCDYQDGKLTETEKFDYSIYSSEQVLPAYTEAGGSMLEFQFEEDIDQIMTNMRQGGFTCNKEK